MASGATLADSEHNGPAEQEKPLDRFREVDRLESRASTIANRVVAAGWPNTATLGRIGIGRKARNVPSMNIDAQSAAEKHNKDVYVCTMINIDMVKIIVVRLTPAIQTI